ncbi:kinesin-like protein KIN-5C [Arachis hypogaea]|uniref:kinesin-like protein KIN-5C n=1 Tax=Arachis hypogaea TaxID=3818 RepID=UPI003B2272E4
MQKFSWFYLWYVKNVLYYSVSTTGSALEHIKRTHEAINEKESKHISTAVSLISDASNRNEQHDMEINSARVAAEEDVAKNSKDLFEQFDGLEPCLE